MSDITKIQIKYIPDIFPHITFDAFKFKNEGQIRRIDSQYDISKTEEKWGLSWDNIKATRTKQAITTERGEVELYVYERTDLALTMSDHCILTDVNGINYDVYDVVATPQQVDRKWKVTLQFSIKTINNFSYPLTHDNTNLLRKSTTNSVNQINFTVNNCPFIQNTTITWNATLSRLEFSFVADQVAKNIREYDVFSFNSNIKELQGQVPQVQCFQDQGDTRDFYLLNTSAALAGTYNGTIQLDTIPEITTTSDSSVSELSLDLTIYTQLNPKIALNQRYNQDLELRQGIIESGNVTLFDTYRTLFFLKESDLYLCKYLQMADTISLTYGSTTVTAEFRKDIVTQKENDLTDQYEFELVIPVNVYNRNLHII